MKSNDDSRERIRTDLLWLAGLVLLAIIVIFVAAGPKRHPSANQSVEAPTNATVTATAQSPAPAVDVTRAVAAIRPSQLEGDRETTRLRATMLDDSLPLQRRREAARALAKIGSAEAMETLKSALTNKVPEYLKVAVAEGLGESPNVEAPALLHQLVAGKDQTVARGAARGLATRGDADAVNTLGNLLFSDQTPLSVRTEAALSLGDVSSPAAQDLLTRAVSQIQNEDVQESVLDGLGRRPFAETEEFFRNYLNSPDVPPASKVLAIEAVADADGEVEPFLQNYVNDANPDVRSAAKSALDTLNPPGAATNATGR